MKLYFACLFSPDIQKCILLNHQHKGNTVTCNEPSTYFICGKIKFYNFKHAYWFITEHHHHRHHEYDYGYHHYLSYQPSRYRRKSYTSLRCSQYGLQYEHIQYHKLYITSILYTFWILRVIKKLLEQKLAILSLLKCCLY